MAIHFFLQVHVCILPDIFYSTYIYERLASAQCSLIKRKLFACPLWLLSCAFILKKKKKKKYNFVKVTVTFLRARLARSIH